MIRLVVAALALSLIGAGSAFAQRNHQNDVPTAVAPASVGTTDNDPIKSASSSGALMHSGEGQTVDEGTLLERRLAASGRTHGSYRAASPHAAAHVSGRRHGRASHGRGRHHERATHGHSRHGGSRHGHASHGRSAHKTHGHAKASHAHASSAHHRRRR